MPFKNIVLFIGALITFVLAALASWYEGGQLRDRPWEWKHTAVFSKWMNDGFTSADNILVIDHFIYAAKFEPLFPLLMAISLLVIVFQLAFWLLKGKRAVRNIFLLLMAALSFAFCINLIDSPTTGFQLFSAFFGMIGLFCILWVFVSKPERIA